MGTNITTLDGTIIVVYFIFILLFGSIFGRYTRTTKDFFFGGQKFSWWLIAMSCVATVVGSYSFIKYSAVAYSYGLSSSMSYLNDWFIVPLFIFGWLPIIYFARIVSVPEYFERRFDRPTRIAATVFIMVYLIGYIGINLYTLGRAMETLLDVNIYHAVLVIAVICAIYVTAGGQTAVIMTDLLQGFVLLIAGFALLAMGIWYLGGLQQFWQVLPVEHRLPFSGFNEPAKFPGVGIFWQDAIGSTIAFYFMNQGVIMRFLSVKSVNEGRKSIIVVILVLMPLAMLATGNAGWLGKAMEEKGKIIAHHVENVPDSVVAQAGSKREQAIANYRQQAVDKLSTRDRKIYNFSLKVQTAKRNKEKVDKNMFVWVAQLLCSPGIFGFIIAALLAALMSTVDTLINAVSAVFVNDIWRPYIKPDMPDKHYLSTARWFSIFATGLGVLLVPIYMHSGTIYEAHGMFTAAVSPPMVVAIVLGAFWRRYTPRAAFFTLIGGGLAIIWTFFQPQILGMKIADIPIFSFGVGPDGYKFTRAFFGVVISGALGIIITFFTAPAADSKLCGTVIGSIRESIRKYKGGEPKLERGNKVHMKLIANDSLERGTTVIHDEDLKAMKADIGDIVYVCDAKWWYGGVKSKHAKVAAFHEHKGKIVMHPLDIEEGCLENSDHVVCELIM